MPIAILPGQFLRRLPVLLLIIGVLLIIVGLYPESSFFRNIPLIIFGFILSFLAIALAKSRKQ